MTMTRNMYHVVWVVGLLGLIAFSSGCSEPHNKGSQIFNPDTGRHISDWVNPAVHGGSAKSQPDGFSTCEECHGSDFTGGISSVACSSCHGGSAPHPTSWMTGTYTHTNTNAGNAAVCALCHTNGANSPIAPPSPPAPAGTTPGCFNSTLCHAQAGHPAGWSSPTQHGASAKAANGFISCETCHGTDFTGGTAGIACSSCHTVNAPHPPAPWRGGTYTHTTTDTNNASVCAQCHQSQAGTPGCFNNTLCHATPTCGSCHGIPPAGTTFPDVAGSHAPHMAVNATIACSTCHVGAGSGTALHENGVVDVIIDPAYNAKSGAATYNSSLLTCSNIGCHGSSRTQNATQAASRTSTPGQTPVWGSGTIDVNTQCTACHVLGPSAGNPENNSYFSGQHYRHVYQAGRQCTDCHDTTKLAAVHFTSLTAPISAATASTTIKSSVNFNGTSCNPSCHGNETW
jgi:predicted CxxxxCH...CXXCH cytochrome family protein